MNMQFIPSFSQETYAPRFTDFSVDTSEIHPLENNEVGFRLVLTGSTLGTVYLDAVVTASDAKSSTICNHTIDPQNDYLVDLDSLQVNTEMLCTVNDSGNVVTADGDQFKLTQEQADAINTYLEDFSELMFEKSIEYAY